jgi:hypothetical protein
MQNRAPQKGAWFFPESKKSLATHAARLFVVCQGYGTLNLTIRTGL